MSMESGDGAVPRSTGSSVREALQNTFNPRTSSGPVTLSTQYKPHPTETMMAGDWQGKEKMEMKERSKPMITDATDAIVRITATSVCGSDLHLYFNALPFSGAMNKHDIIGHEAIGVVEQVGPNVTHVSPGDRVVISAPISCGTCEYCKREEYSACDRSNPSSAMEATYGHRTSALFGYSHLCGGIAGCQAEYTRVPYADVNLLKISDTITDEKALTLADIMCTGWHGCEKAQVGKGDVVVVWGCGPVGLMAAYLAKFRGAKRVISIDNEPNRLKVASDIIGVETINFDEHDVKKRVAELVPGGPDCSIDCVGYRFPKSWTHWFLTTFKFETDAIDVVEEMIYVTRKCGRIALIGDYFYQASRFPIGAFMEKGLQMAGGQLFCQRYWRYLYEQMESGALDPSFIWSHEMKFDQLAEAYDTFGHQKDGCTKILLRTKYGEEELKRREGRTMVVGKRTLAQIEATTGKDIKKMGTEAAVPMKGNTSTSGSRTASKEAQIYERE